MELNLTGTWKLTTEHSASSYGEPVLCDIANNSYGSMDIIKPYPSWGYMPAMDAVIRMTKGLQLTIQQQEFIDKFTGGKSFL